jgi:hypothetical protein
MSLIVSRTDTAATHTLIDEGTHFARCVWVVDLGTQATDFGPKRKVLIGWELPQITRTYDGQAEPAIVSKFFTACLSEKSNLRRDLELWRGRAFAPAELAGFDLRKLLGVTCLLTICHPTLQVNVRRLWLELLSPSRAWKPLPRFHHPGSTTSTIPTTPPLPVFPIGYRTKFANPPNGKQSTGRLPSEHNADTR